MHVNRGLVFWGLVLITAGAVALAIVSGAIGEETARQAWRFWPLALIFIGVAVVAARTPFALVATVAAGLVVGGLAGSLVAGWPGAVGIGCGGGQPTEIVSASGEFTAEAQVELQFNCGELDVRTRSGDAWSVDARHGADAQPRIRDDGEVLRVTGEGGNVIGFTDARQEWDVVLPTDVELDLTLGTNAAASRVDLGDATISRLALNANAGEVRVGLGGARVDRLSIDGNAGSISIDADDETRLDGTVRMNAGALELCAPGSTSVSITIDDPNITFSHDLDGQGFSRDGDTWRSGSGTPAITLDVEGNAANFSYNPDGGCS